MHLPLLVLTFLALFAMATPALAARMVGSNSPEVVDNTGPANAEMEGAIRPGCAPWKNGKSVGIELPNDLGAVVYTSIDSIRSKPGSRFIAVPGELKEDNAVIYRCNKDDSSCGQLGGTVLLMKASDDVYMGFIQTDNDKTGFVLKLAPQKAECLP